METTPNIRAGQELEGLEVIAGNGLLGRRAFLRGGAAFAAAVTGYTVARSAAAEPLKDDPWSLGMGAVTPPLQTPSRFEKHVVRTLSNPNNELRNRSEEHTSELQSLAYLVCRLLLEKKKKTNARR